MPARVKVFPLLICLLLVAPADGLAKQRAKLKGYITEVGKGGSVKILDDVIRYHPRTKFEVKDAATAKRLGPEDLAMGMLIEAEGTWDGRHQFSAKKIVCDWDQFGKVTKDRAYFEGPLSQLQEFDDLLPTTLRVGGEVLVVNANTRGNWKQSPAQWQPVRAGGPAHGLAGPEVRYRGVRQEDGMIAAREVEFGSSRPADAHKISGGIVIEPGQDPQTEIEVLEFRKKGKVQGRLKLFPVQEVQDYVAQLGQRLIPLALRQQEWSGPPEFRFFVIEDSSVNAAAFPDGTILVNTGLLGVLENEAQLAFILSHEIAHVTQIHQWRHVHETRTKRVLLTIAAVAGSYYVGDLGIFLGQLGLAAIWNGFGRRLENQADRMALQNLIDFEYDPRPALGFFDIMIERYGTRSTSALWSNHDSSLLRGSFLTVQIERQYPAQRFEGARVDTEAFRQMRAAMGPVKSL